MNITLCDICEKRCDIFAKWKGDECCEKCFKKKTKHIPKDLIDDWGEVKAEKLAEFDEFIHINYEDFNYPERAAIALANELDNILKKLGVEGIRLTPAHDEENGIIGFNKFAVRGRLTPA